MCVNWVYSVVVKNSSSVVSVSSVVGCVCFMWMFLGVVLVIWLMFCDSVVVCWYIGLVYIVGNCCCSICLDWVFLVVMGGDWD